MLLTSVIIVLREVLEAALLVSILSAMSVTGNIGRGWVGWALLFGALAGLAMSQQADMISGWFDGVGQEVSSAAMQLMIYSLMVVFVYLIQARNMSGGAVAAVLKLLMVLIVGLAVAREGFEILIYMLGFISDLQVFFVILTGAAIGTGIGISLGALIYYLLRGMPEPWSRRVSLILLLLVSAGLLSQAALLLIQADWLPSKLPLWDSSAILAENSVAGQLLYALVGYEATPTAIQAGAYFGGALLVLLVAGMSAWRHNPPTGEIHGG